MNSESELLKALAGLIVTPDPLVEYRLYYDDSGTVVMCMMQAPFPDNKSYVVVNKEQYELYWKYRIVNGKLESIPVNVGYRTAFVKSTKGFRVVKNHAALLLVENEQYPDIEYYDTRNN